MSSWNQYRTFEDFENAELWNSEIVGGALQALDDWEKSDNAHSFEDDLDDDDVEDGFDDDDDGNGEEHSGSKGSDGESL